MQSTKEVSTLCGGYLWTATAGLLQPGRNCGVESIRVFWDNPILKFVLVSCWQLLSALKGWCYFYLVARIDSHCRTSCEPWRVNVWHKKVLLSCVWSRGIFTEVGSFNSLPVLGHIHLTSLVPGVMKCVCKCDCICIYMYACVYMNACLYVFKR